MYFIIYGEDTYRSMKKLGSLQAQFAAKRDASGLNAAVLRAKDADLDAVGRAVFAAPFLAEKKLVVIDGYLRDAATDQGRLLEMLEKKPDSTVVIVYERAGRAELEKSAAFAGLSGQRFSEEFPPLSGHALVRRVVEECRAAGAEIEKDAAASLAAAAAGSDGWALHAEIEKVCAYAAAVGGGPVTKDMVARLAAAREEESLFDLLDACVEGRAKEAVALLESLLGSGVSEAQIIAMLLKQFRTLIGARDLVERGVRDKFAVAKALGVHHFPASKALAAAAKCSAADLRARHRRLLRIDRAMKTGAAKPRTLLCLFAADRMIAVRMP
jgi:DNA polymerase-3 subunit delta